MKIFDRKRNKKRLKYVVEDLVALCVRSSRVFEFEIWDEKAVEEWTTAGFEVVNHNRKLIRNKSDITDRLICWFIICTMGFVHENPSEKWTQVMSESGVIKMRTSSEKSTRLSWGCCSMTRFDDHLLMGQRSVIIFIRNV